jgi:hypothetical protein
MGALVESCLTAGAIHIIQVYRSNALAVIRRLVSIVSSLEAQLATDHVGVVNTPAIVAHCSPRVVEGYLHAALLTGATPGQPQASVNCTHESTFDPIRSNIDWDIILE